MDYTGTDNKTHNTQEKMQKKHTENARPNADKLVLVQTTDAETHTHKPKP